jgi:hypothetical protein
MGLAAERAAGTYRIRLRVSSIGWPMGWGWSVSRGITRVAHGHAASEAGARRKAERAAAKDKARRENGRKYEYTVDP